jgi:transketolase
MDACFWEALGIIRAELEKDTALIRAMTDRIAAARRRLQERGRSPRADAPRRDVIFQISARRASPAELRLKHGSVTTLRGELGRALGYLNAASGGALLIASADLMGSTSSNLAGAGFAPGFYNARTNPGARLLATGGICEDAMSGILGGISSFGGALGVGSSYGAFLAPLGHIAARLHAIGFQARHSAGREPCGPLILVCAHAGLKTGEDGPTHADPQALQLLQGNFPRGTLITLTPWDPQEIWTLLSAALARRPAVIAVFVTRPNENVIDRGGLGLAPATDAADGLYLLAPARGKRPDGTVVLQGSEVAYAYVQETLPLLAKEGIDLEAYYVASAELFDLLGPSRQAAAFPEKAASRAVGITGFTLATMHRWITGERGRRWTLHPFAKGHFLGSGQAEAVMKEAGLDGRGQLKAIKGFLGGR